MFASYNLLFFLLLTITLDVIYFIYFTSPTIGSRGIAVGSLHIYLSTFYMHGYGRDVKPSG